MKKRSKFLSYLFPILLILCMVLSCKSSPSASETEPESAEAYTEVSEEAPAPDAGEEEPVLPGPQLSEIETFQDQDSNLEEPGIIQLEQGQEMPELPTETVPVIPEPVAPPAPETPLPPVTPPFVIPPPASETPPFVTPPPVPETPPLPPPQMAPDQSFTQRELPEPVQPSVPREPPLPPPGLRPAEPPPPIRQPVPVAPAEEEMPVLQPLPGRILPERSGEIIVFSRVVRASVGQLVEIPFRGTGWVYLGELGNRRGMSYDSRRLDVIGGHVEGQSFIFRAETAGTYILKFYKQDFIQDYIINDHVQVIVGEDENFAPGRYVDRGRVVAEPRWPSPDYPAQDVSPEEESASGADIAALPPAESAPAATSSSELTPTEPVSAIPAETFPEAESTDELADEPIEYVRQARQEFDAGRVERALELMDAMTQRYPLGTDEAWWLLGQLFEANSPARDVRLALEYYRRLVREYPQSPRVGDAQRRISYLERYYFNIR